MFLKITLNVYFITFLTKNYFVILFIVFFKTLIIIINLTNNILFIIMLFILYNVKKLITRKKYILINLISLN